MFAASPLPPLVAALAERSSCFGTALYIYMSLIPEGPVRIGLIH